MSERAFVSPTAPEFLRIQKARKHDGLEPLPTDAELTENLLKHGFTMCEGRAYPR